MKRVIVIAYFLLFAVGASAANQISILPRIEYVNVGALAEIDISASLPLGGIDGSIGAFDLDVLFDPALLSFASVTFGSALDPLAMGSIRGTSNNLGRANLYEISLDSITDLVDNQPREFILATITFRAIGVGIGELNLTLNALADASGRPLASTLLPGMLTVTPVDEPSISAFLSIGLLVVGAIVARRGLTPVAAMGLVKVDEWGLARKILS